MKYSVIYALIRPEISEKLSLGLIIASSNRIKIRYSEKKLRVLKMLCADNEYRFIAKTVRSLNSSGRLKSAEDIDYMSRYSNNLLTVSKLKNIDIAQTQRSENWLFRNYVYAGIM